MFRRLSLSVSVVALFLVCSCDGTKYTQTKYTQEKSLNSTIESIAISQEYHDFQRNFSAYLSSSLELSQKDRTILEQLATKLAKTERLIYDDPEAMKYLQNTAPIAHKHMELRNKADVSHNLLVAAFPRYTQITDSDRREVRTMYNSKIKGNPLSTSPEEALEILNIYASSKSN